MHCELYIPNFFPSEGLPRGDGLAAAETLIARGRRRRRALSSPEAWLFERFGVAKQRDWPVAPYTLLADGGAPERHYWMRADPVHLQVGRHSLGLADSASFEVSRSESEALVEALNRHFGQTMLFHPLQPARWYVRLQKTPDMQTTPATAARGAALDEKLPSGPDAMRFHTLMNEAQMLLHEHPVFLRGVRRRSACPGPRACCGNPGPGVAEGRRLRSRRPGGRGHCAGRFERSAGGAASRAPRGARARLVSAAARRSEVQSDRNAHAASVRRG